MHGVLVPAPPDLDSASYIGSPCNRGLRSKHRRAHGSVQTCHFNGWCKALLIISSCWILFALSGCGGIFVVNGAGTGALTASPNTVTFGAVSLGQTASTPLALLNGSSAPVQITQLSLTGQFFSLVSPSDLPVTIAAGGTYSLNVQFNPADAGMATGQLTIASNASSSGAMVIGLRGTGATAGGAILSSLSCTSSALIGSAADACTLILSAAAGSGGLTVSLASNNSAITVPSTVTVPVGKISAGFTATASSVSTAQTVTLKATAGGVSQTFNVRLRAVVPTLSVNATSVAFGNVVVNTAATPQPVILTLTGTVPVTINGAALTGTGFTVSGITFPATLNPGQAATLNVEFEPTAAGAATGQLTITSNSSTGSSTVISLSGAGTAVPAALSALSCSSGVMTGSGTDACRVTLTASAPSSGLIVNLSSSSSAVTVPSTVTVPAGAASAGFTATVSSVATTQAVTMTASAGGMFSSFTLQLNAAILALTINANSVAFGDVVVNTPATQAVTLTSTGTVPVTITGATLTGPGFTESGAAIPATLSPGQEATLEIEFDPAAVGTATGQLTIASNSSTNGSTVVALSGTGTAAPVVAVAVTPATASVTTATTQQFTASVTGTSNTTVTWTASGTGCSGTKCGTISSTGLYTAPAAVPSSATVTITATSVSDPTKSAPASVTVLPPPGATYYLAPASAGGNDSNNGLSPSAPWLTPQHPLNCGDVILAAPSTAYLASNFIYGDWGTVTCPAENNVAWLKCATFDGCKVSGAGGIIVNANYWGVQGWEVTTDTSGEACFAAANSAQIHHIIFANDIANGCQSSGFSVWNTGGAGVDYFAVIGSIAYNASQGSAGCYSGISIYQPVESDQLSGTHIYVAGNFSFGNFNTDPCAGGTPTDGEGIIFDTFDGSQGELPAPYRGQAVADNNILVGNGGRGLQVFNNMNGTAPFASIYFRHNTLWGNNADLNQNFPYCGESLIYAASSTQSFLNLAETSATLGCGAHPAYAFYVANGDASDSVYSNWGYASSGTNDGTTNSTGFSYGPNNVFGLNPDFSNPVSPGAPNCGAYPNVPACMATVVANFTPTNAAATAYGYQIPSGTPIYDPLFPQWLCNVDLPAGLISMGCQAAP